ncbi:carbohydrate ABC transporter permease [Actinomadura sp. HBU206391]|uniref:carbohydrate ABC transporter permease n=1 Tax=Actinomadura sp. HBU206391 TaxID=2731692 RepID=UPI002905BE0C|nr:carbohydrate ABC transporter permease [Actinomadura sp. HBU206391]
MTATVTSPGRDPVRSRRVRRVVWHVVILGLLGVLLYPIAWLVAGSFKPSAEIATSVSLLPEHWEFGNYSLVTGELGGAPVWRFFVNSAIVAGGAVAGNVISCSLAAYAFARLRFRLRTPLFAFMLASIMLPLHVVLIPQYTIFQKLGMTDSFWPLILPKFLATDAFFVFLLVQFIRQLPRELDEAARIDGCGSIRIFTRITLPLLKPALITTAIFTFIWTWNDFLSQLIYLSTPDNYTLPLGLRLFIDQQDSVNAFGPMFALSVLSLLPILLFFAAFQRFLVQGLATSGLKG